jgi:AcrR family transcriptional regulator
MRPMTVRENRSGRQTKEWILETACRLFNEHGTAAVSTKRIAKEMGISPGNLYYHFKNKEEIILALFDASQDEYFDEWVDGRIPPLQRFRDVARDVVLMWQDCRFFKKEMVMLIGNDPHLKQAYQAFSDKIREKANALFHDMIDAGLISTHAFSPAVFDALLNVSILIANHWLTHLDMHGRELSEENLQHGAELILLVWRPYLTDGALAQLAQLEKQDEAVAIGVQAAIGEHGYAASDGESA